MKINRSILETYVAETIVCCEKHPFSDLYIYGYYEDPLKKRLWDDTSKHCRGIIIDGDGNVIEHPFVKFWTFKQYISKDLALLNENQVLRLPDNSFRITEKVDGTMVTLYWIDETPYLATQRSFTNVKAIEATKILHSKYKHLFPLFNRQYTYVFEAIYPETRVLIEYGDMRDLVLIGVIDKKTGKPLPVPDMGFKTCKDYSEEYGHITNFNDLAALNIQNQEGFVIYYESGEMLKIKFPWYIKAHSLLDNFMRYERASYWWYKELAVSQGASLPVITIDDVVKSLKRGDNNFLDIRNRVPQFFYLMGFDYWLKIMSDKITKGEVPLFPQPSIFDFDERMKQPHVYETSIWKWQERFLKG